MTCSRLDPAIIVPAPAQSVPMLLAELIELGREAWRISERERAVRAEIEALRETEALGEVEDSHLLAPPTQTGHRCLT
ncbi:MAG: hypothetical protein ACRDRS_13635 [Pseudonocardiaceae bacterium]